MELKEKIAVMQAFADGKEVEYKNNFPGAAGSWVGISSPMWDWGSCDYRVKREPRRMYARYNNEGQVGSRGGNKEIIEANIRRYGGELVEFVEVIKE